MPEIIIKSAIAERFEHFMAGGRVLFFSAPCGFSKTALAEALLRGQDVLHLSAGDEGFALPPADGRWRVLLLDDLQNYAGRERLERPVRAGPLRSGPPLRAALPVARRRAV